MIKKYSFKGKSPQEALANAKAELGDEFAIETTKQIRPKTLTQSPLYEVIACIEVHEENKENEKEYEINNIKKQIQAYTDLGRSAKYRANLNNNLTSQQEAKPLGDSIQKEKQNFYDDLDNDDISVDISKAAHKIQDLARIKESPDYSAKMSEIEKKVDKLSDKISVLADAVWEDKANARQDLNIPPEFSTIYKIAAQSGMKKEHLKAIMETTIENMPSTMKSNPVAIKRYFYFLLEKMLPNKKEQSLRQKQKVIMLIGPTGVGKTTTLSKLVYKYAYENQIRAKTGIITLDSYRIGAVEQLSQYAQLMQIRMVQAIDVNEFKSALKNFNGYDIVLVDTVGSSQYDTQKLAKLNEVISNTDALMEVNLVLSANTKIEDLLEIYEKFSFANINSLIITKLDETKIFGNIFSLIYETNVPVSYFSIGQNVPEDIMEANSAFLVKCVLEGFSNGSSK